MGNRRRGLEYFDIDVAIPRGFKEERSQGQMVVLFWMIWSPGLHTASVLLRPRRVI